MAQYLRLLANHKVSQMIVIPIIQYKSSAVRSFLSSLPDGRLEYMGDNRATKLFQHWHYQQFGPNQNVNGDTYALALVMKETRKSLLNDWKTSPLKFAKDMGFIK